MSKSLTIGSRGSKLALWQANHTQKVLSENGIATEIKIIKTKGDNIQHLSFDKLEGKGFFTKEIEDALLDGSIDLAVHSCKDLPSESPEGLSISGYSEAANPSDLLIFSKNVKDESLLFGLAQGAVIGTSSSRRKAQLFTYRPDIDFKDIRGNVPTRIQKLRDNLYDGIILASAGIERLEIDLSEFETFQLNPKEFIPAPAQGILAFQTRKDDIEVISVVEKHLNSSSSMSRALAERNLMATIGGGCQSPLGIYSVKEEDKTECLYVSYAQDLGRSVKRLSFDPDTHKLESVKDVLLDVSHSSVFISRKLKEEDLFYRSLSENSWQVHGETFIDFVPISFELDEIPDWIFFTSKNGVDFFLNQLNDLKDISASKIAAINEGTAMRLREHGLSVDYTGSSAIMGDIGANFKEYTEGSVLFPRAKRSLRSIQRSLEPERVIELVVYSNEARTDVPAKTDDVLVFTSPINVSAYFNEHKLQAHQQVIAIGPSTAKALDEFNIDCTIAKVPSMTALVEEVFNTELSI